MSWSLPRSPEEARQLPPSVLRALLTRLEGKVASNRLLDYRPYPKQREFHALGKVKRERLLRAGNQLGKTMAAGAEVAMHLTGRYPSWWDGRVWDKPIVAWVAGVTSEVTRDTCQRVLMGRFNAIGTGMLPADAIKEKASKRGVSEALDHVTVLHGGGGDVQALESLLYFKAFESGREKFQGETIHLGWCDEEPPVDVYTEFLTRTNAAEAGVFGSMLMTFTPLQGMSDVVARFLLEESEDRSDTNMTLDDVDHYTAEQKERIYMSYPPHEREARARGTPTMGSGRIFPVEEATIEEGVIQIPDHWPRVAALDFGWDHPTAAVWMAWDRDTDTVHIYDVYRLRQQPVAVHASAIKARGEWIPVAWPHDGNNDTAAGIKLASQYRDAGVNMMPHHAQYTPQGQEPSENTKAIRTSVEAGVSDMLNRMTEGRLKVAKHLEDWWQEFRIYHRKDGKIVKERDDLMSATRYGIMTLEHAITKPSKKVTLRNRGNPSWRF
jgi:phage terminase large subunit-like protein